MPQLQSTMKPRAKAKLLHKHQLEPLSPPQEALLQAHSSLTQISPITQAVAHRHRNQHSSSHWWRSFGLLRRAIRSFESALLCRSRHPDDASSAIAHAKWMAKHIVPRAYIAFTQLAADNQHAPLGLMLLAILARISRIISDLKPSDHPASKSDPPSARLIDLPSTLNPDPTAAADVDMGVTISRGDMTILTTKSRESNTLEAQEFAYKVVKKKKSAGPSKDAVEGISKNPLKDISSKDSKKKKKKKDNDALSSIFSGL